MRHFEKTGEPERCSPENVFVILQRQMKSEVDRRNASLPPAARKLGIQYRFVADAETFTVSVVQDGGRSAGIRFVRDDARILVESLTGEHLLEGRVITTEDGACKIQMGNTEYTPEQFGMHGWRVILLPFLQLLLP